MGEQFFIFYGRNTEYLKFYLNIFQRKDNHDQDFSQNNDANENDILDQHSEKHPKCLFIQDKLAENKRRHSSLVVRSTTILEIGKKRTSAVLEKEFRSLK